MKNILFIFIVMVFTFGFSGCSPKMLEGVSPSGKEYNGAVNHNGLGKSDLEIMSAAESDKKKKFALIVKSAAKEYEKKGVKYFTIHSGSMSKRMLIGPLNNGLNPLTTNIQDAMDYCFPSSFGLEVKCDRLDNDNLTMYFSAKNGDFLEPVWSVKQVLEDKTFDTDIELVLKEMPHENIVKALKE